MDKSLTYFVSDVHMGLQVGNAAAREAAFAAFLRSVDPSRTAALYLLGDIWDFWYEYRDVVPKGYVQVFAALQDLMRAGVPVYFFQGNHDVWTYHYFADMGMMPLQQPYVTEIGGTRFCLGHGDGLGSGQRGYKFLRGVFHNRFLQMCFSTLHPWFAFRLGNNWSRHSRLGKNIAYTFRGADEPLYRWCTAFLENTPVEHFIFGHYHCLADVPLSASASSSSSASAPASTPASALHLLGDWLSAPNWLVYDAATAQLRRQP